MRTVLAVVPVTNRSIPPSEFGFDLEEDEANMVTHRQKLLGVVCHVTLPTGGSPNRSIDMTHVTAMRATIGPTIASNRSMSGRLPRSLH